MPTSGFKIKITKPRQSTEQQPPERIPPTKRSRVGSDDESDADSLSPPPASSPPPPSSRPKRAAASSGGKSVATDDSDLEEADDADFSDEEGLSVNPSTASRAPSKNAKAKPRRRIQSDASSSPEPGQGRERGAAEAPKGGVKGKGKGSTTTTTTTNLREVRGGHDSITSLYRDERSRRMPGEGSSASTPGGKAAEPALKKRKLPPGGGPPKRAPAVSSLLAAAGSSSGAAPPSIVKNLKSLSRPANANLSGSTDVDLTNMADITSLMQSHRAPPPGEIQSTQYEELRAEARKARLAANHKTFDLMAGSEKIKAFEAELERMGVWPMPQVLLSALTVPAQGAPSRPP